MLHRLWALTLAGAIVTACETPPKLDLQLNENLYRPTGFKARHPMGGTVFVAPVVDQRQAPKAGPGEAVGYLRDDDWDRAPTVMVQALLAEELVACGLFAAAVDKPAPEAVELVPTLKAFEGGLHEQPFGRRSLAAVDLLLEVRGPETNGARATILSESFGSQQVSNVDFRPPSPRVLLGTSLRTAITKGLAALDNASAAAAAKPAEASGTKR